MFNLRKEFFTGILLSGLVLFTTNNSFAHHTSSEDKSDNEKYKTSEPIKINSKKNKINNNEKSVVWTEGLTFQDFYLFSETIEMRDKVKEYKKVLAKTYEENPAVFSTAISYGLLLIDLNEIEKARIVWEKAAKDFRSNESVQTYKAWLDARLGKFEDASNVWSPIAKLKIDRGVVGYSSGIWLPYHVDAILGLYLIKDNLPESEKRDVTTAVNTIMKMIPQNPKFAAALINDYLKSGQTEKAAELLATVLKNYPEDPTLITLLGVAQLMANHYDEAIKLFDRVNEIDPKILTAHTMKARALFALNKEKESFEELEIAMKLNPDLSVAENKKKKYLAQKSYMVSKKIKKEPTIETNKNIKEQKGTEESKG